MLQRLTKVAPRLTRASLGWEKAADKFTGKDFAANMQMLEAKFETDRRVAQQVSKTLEPIDWAFYEREIKSPGVVADIKRAYENHKFDSAAADQGAQRAQQLEKDVAAFTAYADEMQALLPEWERNLVEMQWYQQNWMNVTVDAYFDANPGLKEKMEDDCDSGWWFVDENQQRLCEMVDFSAIKKDLESGNFPVLPEHEPIAELEAGMAEITAKLDAMDQRINATKKA